MPNYKTSIIKYPKFEVFFKQIVSQSQDFQIAFHLKTETVKGLPTRSKQMLLSALSQYELEIDTKFQAFLSQVNPISLVKVPKTVLFSTDQNAITYIALMQTLIPYIEEDILVESFILLHNCKAQLLQNLATEAQIVIPVQYITYSQFWNLPARKSANYAKPQTYR